VIILFIIAWGMAIGWLAELIVNRGEPVNYGRALAAGIGGSFVGGMLSSLLAGDGLRFRPSGIIGSIVGAIIVLAVVRFVSARR
jgi:uncharacterized membrane protein YeaQ/YmgE (transglycosylase-associated protein family)